MCFSELKVVYFIWKQPNGYSQSLLFVQYIILNVNMNYLVTIIFTQIVVKLQEGYEAWRFIIFTFVQIFRLFYLTLPCERLIDHSININNYM